MIVVTQHNSAWPGRPANWVRYAFDMNKVRAIQESSVAGCTLVIFKNDSATVKTPFTNLLPLFLTSREK